MKTIFDKLPKELKQIAIDSVILEQKHAFIRLRCDAEKIRLRGVHATVNDRHSIPKAVRALSLYNKLKADKLYCVSLIKENLCEFNHFGELIKYT